MVGRSGDVGAGAGKAEFPAARVGDRVVRSRRRRRPRGLRRILGVPALYSIGYGNVGSSIYYALGITAVYALGATPIALMGAGIFFVFTAMTYAEGAALIPEAGGSSSFARRGFNEFWSFIAGWSLMLDYMVTMAISAVTVPFYLGYFFPALKESHVAGTLVGMGLMAFLMILNIVGVRETSGFNIFWVVLDLLTQGLLVVLGVVFLLNIQKLIGYVEWGGSENWPTLRSFIYGISISMIAYTGLESVCQMAEEAREPEKMVPRSLMWAVVTVLVMYALISVVALSAMTPRQLATEWSTDPVAGIAHHLPDIPVGGVTVRLSHIMAPWVAVLAASILLIASNAGLLGISRLAFSLGQHQQLPGILVKIHPRFRTPYIGIVAFSVAAILLLVPGLFAPGILLKLGDLYSFGAMLSFTLAHASIIALRIKEPQLPRPFEPWANIRWRGARIPLTAILGSLGTCSVWLIVIATHPWGRTVGFVWLAIGIAMYVGYRRRHGLPLTVTVKAAPPILIEEAGEPVR
jgi:APA family basic amino acid/polyamine antiporter